MSVLNKKRVTLQDVANATGYSVNTISHALKNKPDIAPATREKIQQVAHDMGYVRNEMARSLRSGRTKTLGVVVGGMSNPFYGLMADAIQDAAMKLGYTLLILCSRDKEEIEQKVLETAISRQVDGVLLFPSWASQKSIDRLNAVGIPHVLMARYLKEGQDDSVVCDEEKGAYLATKHLLDAGRKPAYLSSFDVVYSSEKRFAGFLRACREAGLPEEECRHAVYESNEDLIAQVLKWKEEGVNGLFMFCDLEAWNINLLMHQQGLRIPDDFALVGFDNIQESWNLPSPLCTIGWDTVSMVDSAISILRRRIHHEEFAPQTVVYDPYLVCRGSCGC